MNPIDLIIREYCRYRDENFENSLGIQTSLKSQIILKENLQTDSVNRQHATAYQGVWYDIIEKLMKAAAKHDIEFSQYTFVDVGSGMGKACFCASEFGFKKIRGFDFDPTLIKRAKENLEIVRTKKVIDVEFFVGDAGEVILPVEPTFLFFYHPFDHVMMRTFLNNNIELFQAPVYIGYSNDQFKFLLEDMGLKMLYRNKKRRTSLWSNVL